MVWQTEAFQYLLEGNYSIVSKIYETIIEASPEEISNYWYLSLAYLLQGKEEEASSIWLSVLSEGNETDIAGWINQLVDILETEALRQASLENYQVAWLLRGHIKEIFPESINNLLYLIELEILLEIFLPEKITDWQVINLLEENTKELIDENLLLQVLGKVLEFPCKESVMFTETCLKIASNLEKFMSKIVHITHKMVYEKKVQLYGIDLIKVCLKKEPLNLSLLKNLFWYYADIRDLEKGLEIAEEFYQKSNSHSEKVLGSYQILYVHMLRADWLKVKPLAQRHQELIQQMIEQKIEVTEPFIGEGLIVVSQPLLYIEDNPQLNRPLQNYISKLFQQHTLTTLGNLVKPISTLRKTQKQKLKIGYIGHTLRTHSVGWLSRWLFQYHNRENFQIALYLMNQLQDQFTEEWFKKKVDIAHLCDRQIHKIIDQIREDEIDILVDLDSLTLNSTCQVLSFKPAPIQVTWLGLDASGLPAIDYFLADNYVLPENASDYYHEKIWRLPETYLAIDGFEVGIPTIRRDNLDIPADGIIYLNIQGPLKRHPDTIRLQMKIIKAVKNSYFLIKGRGDDEITKQLYTQIAEEEGVSPERLRFLPLDITEETHRANLAIADVVLDTYPYNGATTTLEVLWMGIPLVTRVGEQFAARNSYGFMKNAGLTEGIAWSDEEYVEWGIKFGVDANLREQVTWKLKNSRKTSPLWKAKQFTLEMEKAYQQMYNDLAQGNI